MFERRWKAVAPQLLATSGTSTGDLTVADASLFRVKQRILIKATSLPNLILEVKAISEDGITIGVGPCKTDIRQRTDISAYTTLLLSTIEAPEQERSLIPEEQIERLTYQEEPAVARRTLLVDNLGRPYRTDNPLPVQLSDGSISIENVHANVAVQLTAKDDDPKPGDIHDSVRIGDGTNELKVNADGSINVSTSAGAGGNVSSVFSAVTSVPASTTTDILTYTAGTGVTTYMTRIELSGTNIATYEVHVNGVVQGRLRTWFNGQMSDRFEFTASPGVGYKLNPGDVVKVKVTHGRPFLGDFEARLQTVLT